MSSLHERKADALARRVPAELLDEVVRRIEAVPGRDGRAPSVFVVAWMLLQRRSLNAILELSPAEFRRDVDLAENMALLCSWGENSRLARTFGLPVVVVR